MSAGAFDLAYDDSRTRSAWLVRSADDGALTPLDVARWSRLDPVDEDVLRRVRGAALDIGCGPGRLCAALARRGVPTLGIDISGRAVRLARRSGAPALRRSVFDPVPHAGRWGSALLLDGNVGIGGDVDRLLRRVAGLLAPGGELLAELTAADGTPPGRSRLRLETAAGRTGPWFPWAQLPVDRVGTAAVRAGLQVVELWSGGHGVGERWFARCRRP